MIRFGRLAGVVAVAAILTTIMSTSAATQPACEFTTVTDVARVVDLVPPHVGGDREFEGHGPSVAVRVSLATRQDAGDHPMVLVHVDMTARETTSDFTTAAGGAIRTIRVWLTHPSWRVDGVVGMDTIDSMSYVDSNTVEDVFGPSVPTSFVSRYRAVGDSLGDDAGTQTSVQVGIKPITLRLSRGCA